MKYDLFAKLKEGNPGFDVIFPSDYMVETMTALNMLVPLNHQKIPNIKNIDPDPNFSNPAYSPGLKYAIPYMWGTVDIGYRKSKFKSVPTSWKILLDSDEFKGRIALLALTLSLDDFVITFFTSGPGSTTLPIKIFSMVRFRVTPEVNAASTVLIVITLTLTVVTMMIQSRSSKGKGLSL